MDARTQETSTEYQPTPANSEMHAAELVLVYEMYYKIFEWRRRSEVIAMRRNGRSFPASTSLSFSKDVPLSDAEASQENSFFSSPLSWGSDTISITVPWCLQDTYDDDDDDDGYDDGDCALEEDETEEV
ncbi:hypothetical protein IFR05_005861 [Cadophora sp. M221]|nr:hypothetical protein IFR05_005861 [Cadophora sp. M221]